jgi:hypothetical protein
MSAVRALPMWMRPVGEGAKRTIGGGMSFPGRDSWPAFSLGTAGEQAFYNGIANGMTDGTLKRFQAKRLTEATSLENAIVTVSSLPACILRANLDILAQEKRTQAKAERFGNLFLRD